MTPPSTDPDDYIRTGRFSLTVSGLLLAAGVALVAWGADPSKPLLRELGGQVGVALVTTAIIDLVLLRGVEAWKSSLAAPFVNLARAMQTLDGTGDRIIEATKRITSQASEAMFREQVRTELESLKIELMAIRLAVDPRYLKELEEAEGSPVSDLSGNGVGHDNRPAEDLPPNPGHQADG